jgi:hypothetical protein
MWESIKNLRKKSNKYPTENSRKKKKKKEEKRKNMRIYYVKRL